MVLRTSAKFVQARIQAYAQKVEKAASAQWLSDHRPTTSVNIAAANRFISHAIPELTSDQKTALREVCHTVLRQALSIGAAVLAISCQSCTQRLLAVPQACQDVCTIVVIQSIFDMLCLMSDRLCCRLEPVLGRPAEKRTVSLQGIGQLPMRLRSFWTACKASALVHSRLVTHSDGFKREPQVAMPDVH